MAKRNPGKIFEDCFARSVPGHVLVKRLNDNAAGWSGGGNTRFASTNESDFIMFDSCSRTFYALELKSTQEKSLTFWREDFDSAEKKSTYQIRKCQIQGLYKWSLFPNCVCGFIINFRSQANKTYFINITDFLAYTNSLPKKSVNINDILMMHPVEIKNKKIRTNYKYDTECLFGQTATG